MDTLMDALTSLETRAVTARGRSIFEGGGKTEAQRMAGFAAALGEGQGDTIDLDDQAQGAGDEQDVDEGAQGAAAGDEQEHPATGDDASEASRGDGMAVPSIDLENLERTLANDVGKKAAKSLIDNVARPLAQGLSGVAAQAAQVRVERLVGKFGAVYPELKRPAALNAVIQTALASQKKGDTDETAFKRALHEVYGDRKREMRTQTTHQMSAPGRSTDTRTKPTRDQANIAALAEYEKHGDARAALTLKRKLMSD